MKLVLALCLAFAAPAAASLAARSAAPDACIEPGRDAGDDGSRRRRDGATAVEVGTGTTGSSLGTSTSATIASSWSSPASSPRGLSCADDRLP